MPLVMGILTAHKCTHVRKQNSGCLAAQALKWMAMAMASLVNVSGAIPDSIK